MVEPADREADVELTRRVRERAVLGLDEAPCDRESEPGPSAPVHGDEWREHLVLLAGRKAGAVVDELDDRVAANYARVEHDRLAGVAAGVVQQAVEGF